MLVTVTVQHDPACPITIVVADDHEVMRSGLRMLLEAEPEFAVVGEAGTIPLTFQEVRTHRPGVLVLDLNMPGGSSIDAIARIRQFSPDTSIVILTMERDHDVAQLAYEAGAQGYVAKEAAADHLVQAIRRAAREG